MRTAALIALYLVLATPVRAAEPPPDLAALYEFAPGQAAVRQ